jgi:hypothetical protein
MAYINISNALLLYVSKDVKQNKEKKTSGQIDIKYALCINGYESMVSGNTRAFSNISRRKRAL